MMLSSQAGVVGRVALGQARLSRDQEGPREVAAGSSAAPLSGERASHPSPLQPEPAGEASLLDRGTNFSSALLSVTKERVWECEDAVDPLRFCESFSFAVETLVRKTSLAEVELLKFRGRHV